MAEAHSALDAAVHAFLFVVPDVEARMALEQALQRAHSLAGGFVSGNRRRGSFRLGTARETHDLPRQRFRIGDQVGGARENDALRHSGELRRFGRLHEHQPPGFVQGAGPICPVAAGAGQDDGDRIFRFLAGERLQQGIDKNRRHRVAVLPFEKQPPPDDFKQMPGGEDEDFACRGAVAIFGDADRQLHTLRGENLGQLGVVVLRKMLGDQKCGLEAFRDHLEKRRERGQAASRATDDDERNGVFRIGSGAGRCEGHQGVVSIG